MSKQVRRLFRQFQPENYKLELDIDPESLTFRGTVAINGKKTGRPSQRLTFHQSGLKISSASITRRDKRGDQTFETTRINAHAGFEEVRLHTVDMLYPGNYTVTLQFAGTITRNMEGIYPCFFKHDGKDKKLIATQFESHHAREAFPCIDEPEAKATFDLALITSAGQTVIANTPVKELSAVSHQSSVAKKQTTENGIQKTVFETTPRMSTYLLAFVAGDMRYKEAKTKGGVTVRTYATPDNIKHTDFALDVAVQCLEFYNEYFDIPYPLAKCDFIALPDFASGAMENWGCITFREQCLLVDPKNTSLPLKQYVAMVVAHELTHQWFGNLVTMRWWNDLWLNESFATWMSYLAIDKLFPEWEMWTQFGVDEQQPAFRLDALTNTHPIEVTINHPDEIRTIFDAISYEKGASVLQMLHDYLGKDAFRNGLRVYLKQHAYQNTITDDLWAALESTSDQPVTTFMNAWTSQPGFPVVRASVNEGHVQLHQQRFLLNPASAKTLGTASNVWPVPLQPSQPLTESVIGAASLEVPAPKQAQGLLLNRGRSAFYRVAYNPTHLQWLAVTIKAGEVDPLDRLGLLSDTFETAKAGHIATDSALQLLEAYADEDNALVWDIIAGNLGGIRAVMDDEDLRDTMKPYMRKLVAKQLKRLGWEQKPKEAHFDTLLRPTILGLASFAEVPEVVTEAKRRFKAMTKPEDLVPEIRGIIYGTAARLGAKPEYDKLLKLYNATDSSEERVTLAAALTAFEQPELIKRSLALIMTDAVRLQDVSYWVAYSFMNRHAKKLTWDWMITHWSWLDKNLGKDLSFYRMPNYAARAFSDAKFLPTYIKFFESVTSPALERPLKQGIETIEWQSAWRERDLQAVKAYFSV